jgi:hypothetical protein
MTIERMIKRYSINPVKAPKSSPHFGLTADGFAAKVANLGNRNGRRTE